MSTLHDKIITLKQTGVLSNKQIAAQLGCSDDYVRAAWLRHTKPKKYIVEYGAKTAKANRERYWSDPGWREKRLEISRAWLKKEYYGNPEYRERRNRSSKEWKARNREHCTEYMRQWRARKRS